MENNILSKKIWKVSTLETSTINDGLAVEEPLEIQVSFGQPQARTKKSISITMRTPGDDPELALGFLYTEGIIKKPNDVQNVLMPESLLPGMVNNVIQTFRYKLLS
jgi:FdhD protein